MKKISDFNTRVQLAKAKAKELKVRKGLKSCEAHEEMAHRFGFKSWNALLDAWN